MIPTPCSSATASHRKARRFGELHHRIAQSLIGRAVSLHIDAQTITHGIVTGVLNDTGAPQIVVQGMLYNLEQILTSTPGSLDS